MDRDKAIALALIIAGSAVLMMQKNALKKKKRNRKCWVRSWVAKRPHKSIMNLVNDEFLKEDHAAFKNYLRMSNESFLKLLAKVETKISKQDTVMRQCISARYKLMVTLRYLATGETYRNLMYSTRIHESTIAQFIPQVCSSIYNVLAEDYLKVH